MFPTFRLAALAVATAVLFSAAPATAASWLDKAKGALDSVTGSSGSGGTSSGTAGGLSTADISAGLREALKVGTEKVVQQVGATDGYNADPAIHIPLPDTLNTVHQTLSKVGMGSLTQDLETRINRAAEAAAPEAKEVLWQAITEMTLDDAKKILDGPDNAATQYFQSKMTPALTERFTPIVDKSLSEVGAIASYDKMMGQYKSVPFVPDVKADLTAYSVEKALDGLFHYVAKEEAAIRANPVARTTDILKKVFGS